MAPKKVTAVSGNGGMKKKKNISGKRKERDFSSDDEFDYEQENNKKPGKPCAKSALQPVTVAEDIKEKIVGLLVGYRRWFLCTLQGWMPISAVMILMLGFVLFHRNLSAQMSKVSCLSLARLTGIWSEEKRCQNNKVESFCLRILPCCIHKHAQKRLI